MFQGHSKVVIEIERNDYEMIYHEFEKGSAGETLTEAIQFQEKMNKFLLEKQLVVITSEFDLLSRSLTDENITFPIRATIYNQTYFFCMNSALSIYITLSKHPIEFFSDNEEPLDLKCIKHENIINYGGLPVTLVIYILSASPDDYELEDEDCLF